jgi:ABC-type phosphate transport system auxiliary subunit
MPVTAKLSRKFYDKLGDDVANELVEWFNKVDATYRADLRELNELNFARFDAKVEQRLAQLGADIRAEFHREIAGLRAELRGELGDVRTGLAGLKAELVKWMFLFWVGTAVTVIGLLRP